MSEGNSAQLEIVPLKTKKRKKRTIFRPEETQVLKDYFVRNHKPSSEEFERLAKQLDKTKLEIQVWFNNRRQAVRPTERRAEPQPVLRRFYQP